MRLQDELVDLLSRTPVGESGTTRVNCPACPVRAFAVDTRKSLSINTNTGRCRCFRCGWSPRLPGHAFFEEEEAREATEEWTDAYDFDWPENYGPVTEHIRGALDAREYLKSRGISKITAVEANLQYCYAGKYAGMVITPFMDRPYGDPEAGWAGWQGRSIAGPKRLHTSKDRRVHMYNWTAIAQSTDIPLMVVEGPYDALSYWPNAVCCLGKPTSTHLDMLSKASRPLVVVLDGDAWKEGNAVASVLRGRGARCVSIQLPAKSDPNSVNHAELWSYVISAFE